MSSLYLSDIYFLLKIIIIGFQVLKARRGTASSNTDALRTLQLLCPFRPQIPTEAQCLGVSSVWILSRGVVCQSRLTLLFSNCCASTARPLRRNWFLEGIKKPYQISLVGPDESVGLPHAQGQRLIFNSVHFLRSANISSWRIIRQGDRKSTRLNSSHSQQSRMPSSA